jgi:hypothetical protein
MDLDALKAKFRHKTTVDLKDIDIALSAVPFLVREVERLERELGERDKRIAHMQSQLQRRIPLSKVGKRGSSEWETRVDEDANRLYIRLAGGFDYASAKAASNAILQVLPNIRKGFDVINDISGLGPEFPPKALFHLRKVMYNLKKTGAARVVRIAPKAPAMTLLFDQAAQSAGFQVHTAGNLAEAEALLYRSSQFLKT